ncbi:hypothetical protein F4781DRAFT_352821 [Annulohypoxylon bovei var. microspora]|nr:hypothetical protein F4781DRAFT_352821 [Annulohypoxylon bovei var. microspora]
MNRSILILVAALLQFRLTPYVLRTFCSTCLRAQGKNSIWVVVGKVKHSSWMNVGSIAGVRNIFGPESTYLPTNMSLMVQRADSFRKLQVSKYGSFANERGNCCSQNIVHPTNRHSTDFGRHTY